MERAQKAESITSLKDKFSRMTSLVMLDYKGINVETVTKLRAEFRKAGVEYKVAKNTLVKQALKEKKTIPQVVRERGLLDEATLEKALDPALLTEPGIPGK